MPEMLTEPLSGPMTWTAETLLENDGRVTLGAECLGELEAVAADLRANPLAVEALDPADFDMPACEAAMRLVRRQLDQGIGFAIVDRLPLDAIGELGPMGEETATRLYWLMMSMVGRPVAQKWDGTMVYDVTDTGGAAEAGNGVRSSKTKEGQGYHTDNSFNLPPDFVALFCRRPAKEGGVSGLISFETVYNRLLAQHPDVVARLYRPFWFDRQLEHVPGEDPVSRKPVVEYDGAAIGVAFSPRLVRQGYAVKGEPMDDETTAALAAVREICEDPGLAKSFAFEPGQIQIVNNRRLGHRRTAYTDWPEPERRRHLVRIWLRKAGRPFYQG